MNPFLDVTVQPGYGAKQCVVAWRLSSEFVTGDVYVYRAPAAQGPWTILNDETPIKNANHFVDETFAVTDSSTRAHYRLLLEHRTGDYDSPVVGIFEKLSKQQFGIARRLLRLDLFHKRQAKNGMEVFVYKPKISGPRCRCVDKDTGQSTQASLCPYCYGTGFEGGYHNPVTTWLEIDKWSERRIEDKPGGDGSVDMRMAVGSCLAFPELVRGDVIVRREVDDRYAVVISDPKYFNMAYPIGQALQMQLLPRQDVRYKIPLPT